MGKLHNGRLLVVDDDAAILRMYERYCGQKGFVAHVLHQSFGEAGGPEGRIGTKSVTIEVRGKYQELYNMLMQYIS